ncbi:MULTISPECIES: helix-turn-helix domain-containing protein [Janibacter]|uniref:helix-turn-helix domain-containing protein n=1 Tax=Janibacter TaxID=53457 RepID=UPI000B32C73C|nr:helix-turn-helix transcriptional regulator [Janibacter terrae]
MRLRVGGNVRRLRVESGLTQEALALESGLSRNHLIELEHGRRGVLFERLDDLALALDVPVTALLD